MSADRKNSQKPWGHVVRISPENWKICAECCVKNNQTEEGEGRRTDRRWNLVETYIYRWLEWLFVGSVLVYWPNRLHLPFSTRVEYICRLNISNDSVNSRTLRRFQLNFNSFSSDRLKKCHRFAVPLFAGHRQRWLMPHTFTVGIHRNT